MKLKYQTVSLQLKHTFRTSREASDWRHNVISHLEHQGLEGLGEAAPSAYYGQDAGSVARALDRMRARLGHDPFSLETILDEMARLLPQESAARAAVDIALHDLIGKILGMPLYRLFGLDPAKTPQTSVTVGLDKVEIMQEKVRQLGDVPIIKIKVGTEEDVEIVRAIRDVTQAVIRVDANAAWSAPLAAKRISALRQFDIEFVEQPLAADDLEGLQWLKRKTDVPIILDESVRTAEDIPALVGCADGINIKLMKSGGLREALRMIHVARAHRFQVMLGCMVESSVAISAAAQLSPLVDYADLDGHLLIENDPYKGVSVVAGKLVLPDRPGIGVEARCPQRGSE